MLTSFEAFGGRKSNITIAVAEAVKLALGKKHPDWNIQICQLPVIYDVASEKAIECYNNINPKPQSVLSMGEALDRFSLESLGKNLDDDIVPDNMGQVRTQRKIKTEGVNRISVNAPLLEMYCSLASESQDKLILSSKPGNFICNNTIYLLADFFKNTDTKFAFVHIPNSNKDLSDRAPQSVTEKIVKLVEAEQSGDIQSKNPSVKQELANYKESLKNKLGSTCAKQFWRRFKEILDQ